MPKPAEPAPTSRVDAARYAEGCAWIDGAFVPIAEARIPITDTGVTRSDCTYDVVSVWNGRFFRLDDHLARFADSCKAMRLRAPLSAEALRTVLIDCVRRAGLREAYVEMIVTRGVPPPGERDPRRFENRFYAFAIPYVWLVKPEQQETGVAMVIARDATRIDPAAVDPRVKNFHWGDLVRGLFEAYDRDATQVVLLNAAGEVTEGPGFNVFALSDGCLWTPSAGVLEGITRRSVLELAARSGVPTRVAMFTPEVLHRASEVFITSTAGGVMAVTRLDGRRLGDGTPGPLTRQLREAYWEAHNGPLWATAIEFD